MNNRILKPICLKINVQISKAVLFLTRLSKKSRHLPSSINMNIVMANIKPVCVEVISINPDSKSTGKAILESALEYDADLIVMGAYGHTRLKEVVLGGATRYLLRHTTIPLFISH